MSPAERRRALLGEEVITHIQEVVDAAPPPDAETIATLRRIFHGASSRPTSAKAPAAA